MRGFGAVTGGAVTGGGVVGPTLKLSGVVVGGAVTGGAVAAWDVADVELLLGAPEPDVANAIPPTAISATTIPVTMGSGLRLKGKPCSPNQPCLCWERTAAGLGDTVASDTTPDSNDGTACGIGGGGR